MFLKQVTINGFKSFADKTSLSLPKGITCIVGPNGCGKSNIVDAIRWVLGEQSAKALRGGKMQDVIFQGTDKRKPLQFCDVSLLFSDCEAQLGLEFNEVEISRKVHRDGGSEYYINGKAARLKDIQHLFMDTGVGRVSYSFMVQGQIDQILSSNPGERRSIFEEAAGITRYKSQRREALNKLALVDQNLARVTDRIGEIERQIGTLRRQAAKALRYKRLSYRLKHLDLALGSKNYSDVSKLVSADNADFEKSAKSLFALENELAEADRALSGLRTQRAEIAARLEGLRQGAAELRSAKEQAQMNSEFANVRQKDLEDRKAQIARESESLVEQLQSLEGRARGDEEVKQMQLNLVTESDEVFRRRAQDLAAADAELKSDEDALSACKQDILVNEGLMTRLRSKCTTLEVDLKSYQVRHAGAADSIFQLKEESAVLERKVSEASSASENAKQRLCETESETAAAAESVNTLRASYRDLQMQIQTADRQLASKSARLGLLNDFQSRMEGFSEGVKAILKGRIAEFINPAEAKVASQNVEVSEDWTQAFETLMGGALDAVALEDFSKVRGALGAIRAKALGKACLQTSFTSVYTDQTPPAGAYAAAGLVRPSSNCPQSLKPLIENLLKGCYFCDDISAFAEWACANPSFKFFACVSKDGDMFDSRGFLYVSTGEKGDTESSFILRTQAIRRLKDEIESENAALTEMNEKAMDINSRLSAAEEEVEQKKNAASEIRRELSSMGAQISALNSALAEKSAELERKQTLLNEMENSRFEAQDRLNAAMQELGSAEKSVREGRDSIESREARIAELRRLKDRNHSVLYEAQLDLADKKSRLQSLERGLGAILEQQRETRLLIERRAEESAAIVGQIAKLAEDRELEKLQSEKFAKELEGALARIEETRVSLSALEEKLSAAEESMNLRREAQRREGAVKNDLELKLAKNRTRLDYIAERVRADYDCDISSVNWKNELWLSDEEFEVKVKFDDIEEGDVRPNVKRDRGEPAEADFAAMDSTDFSIVESEVRELRDKISAMGAVNLVAIEEYTELRERFDFLKTQSEDLWSSKNELVAAIDEINATSQKMFSDTFEQIRKNFEFTFKKLFGGGSADLKLVESEDVLDSGIEIVARPPGTVLKSLSLLSGGQRTMTAVSLLFAIYMVKPSPFCVLDELDAPLDDANIGRYTDMLKEFTRYSQFLVISHNKRTVAAANTIYGVTQQERGVTRLISMRFNPASSEIEQAAEVQP